MTDLAEYINREKAIDIIRKHWSRHDGDTACQKAIDELRTCEAEKVVSGNKPRWIPVTERLPEDGSLVGKLIADSDGCIRIASQCAVITLSGGKTVYTDLIDLVSFLAKDTPTTEWEDCTHITHWMPLSEPPKEEK